MNFFRDDLRVLRLWHLPRAKVPEPVTGENNSDYSPKTLSTLSSNETYSNPDLNNTADSDFFKELDQKMGDNLRATRARPNTGPMLASLPADTISLASTYDPINELDSIIDNEDLNQPFDDPLDDLFNEDDDIAEAVNPNANIPRANIDSKPRGIFSV